MSLNDGAGARFRRKKSAAGFSESQPTESINTATLELGIPNENNDDDLSSSSEPETIASRITNVVGHGPGSKVFSDAKVTVQKFIKLFSGQLEADSLDSTFRKMTDNLGGELTRENLPAAMEKVGVGISKREESVLFPILDLDGDGSVDMEEFRHFCTASRISDQRICAGIGDRIGSMRYERTKLGLQKLLMLIPQNILAYFSGKGELVGLRRWLENVDANGDGVIDAFELKAAMDRTGTRLTQIESQSIVDVLDKNGSGSFDLEELTTFVTDSTAGAEFKKRIQRASGGAPGSQAFAKCKAAISKLLASVPGRAELAELKKVYEIIANGAPKINKEFLVYMHAIVAALVIRHAFVS
jgi:Ca2+-binding EF-hand superfamily protein